MHRSHHTTSAIALGAILLIAAACGGGSGSAAASSAAPTTGAPSAASTASTASRAAVVSAAASQDAGGASAGTGGSTAGNDRCAEFTTGQVTALIGDAPFQTAEPGILDVPGCQWYFSAGAGNVNLQILPGAQYGDWSGKPGVTAVSGVGDSAFVGPYVLGGTMAGAQVGSTFYFLTAAPAPSNDVVVSFLKQAIAQAGGG
jgi:hypothetical protein